MMFNKIILEARKIIESDDWHAHLLVPGTTTQKSPESRALPKLAAAKAGVRSGPPPIPTRPKKVAPPPVPKRQTTTQKLGLDKMGVEDILRSYREYLSETSC